MGENPPGVESLEQKAFSKRRLVRFLFDLEADTQDFLTVYIKPSSFADPITRSKLDFGPFDEEIRVALTTTAAQAIERYASGAVIFWTEAGERCIIVPPFEVEEDSVFWGKAQIQPLHQLLRKARTIGVVLVTWGSYAIGVFDGDEPVVSKVGTGHIHKRHRKGGSSQARFARRTEEQKKEFLRRASNRIEELFRGHHPQRIFFGGNRLILKPLLDECPYLQSREHQISERVINVRYADREALEASLEDIGRSQVFMSSRD